MSASSLSLLFKVTFWWERRRQACQVTCLLKWRSTVTCDVWKCTTLVIPEVMNSKFGWSESSCHRTRAYHAPRDKHIWNFFVLPSLIRHGKDFAPPSTPGFSDKVGLNLALCLVTSCSRLHDWYLHAVGWDEGPRALVAPLEDTGVGVGLYKKYFAAGSMALHEFRTPWPDG